MNNNNNSNSNNGESRESLDLLASAAEQSSPSQQSQTRIKRNTACVSCRDSKVRCVSTGVAGQPCTRCVKLKLDCRVDKSHKRVSKRSKFEELVQEVQSIKQAVASDPRGPTTPGGTLPQGQLPLPALPQSSQHLSSSIDQNNGDRLFPSAPYGPSPTPITSIASFSQPAPPRVAAEASSVPDLTPGQITTPSSADVSRATSQPRALKSRVFAGQDIDFYFDTYFEHFHPYLPIVRIREPDAIYNSGPVLFWVIMVTACRRTTHRGGVFDFLVDAVKSEVWESVADPPMSLATINALLILSTWPLPTIRFMKDPSPIYVSMLMNSCYLLGIHTGRGDFPAFTFPMYRLSTTNEEAVYTWVGYNIVSQRISTYSGTPSTGQFFNRTIESVLDRTSSVQVPNYFYVLLESASFLNRVSKSMAASLEEGRGVSHHVVDNMVEDFSKLQRILSAQGVSDVDHFTIMSTLLEVQVYYFLPVPEFSVEIFKRNALRCYTTAESLTRLAVKLQNEISFLANGPHFFFRSILTAGCVMISALISPTLKDIVEAHIQQQGSTPELVIGDALSCVRSCSVQEGDLPLRAAKMMESAFNVRHILPPTELSQLGMPEYSHRMGMGLPLDCIRRWKRQMETLRNEKVPPTAVAAAGVTGGGVDVTAGAGAGLVTGQGVDPTTMIDWDAFMKDFDWNFDPSLIDTVVPPA